jgi:nucleoside-diphosphate-sugar epimerase
MTRHVIVGAGPIGTAAARTLAERGERVTVVTRRGGGPEHPAIERVAADATDADRLTAIAEGAAALYNCANPRYHQWFADWPPLHQALLTAAERSGAVLTIASNLYGYGAPTGPMTESTPLAATHPKLRLRADMWRDALALHEAGRIRVTEVRASDYIEANSRLSDLLGKPILAGRRGYSVEPLDQPHTWTAVTDVGRLLATVSTDERAWGRAWHVPSVAPLTLRELCVRFAEVNGAPAPKLTQVPYPAFWAVGLFNPLVKELRTVRYQFDRPFVLDSSAATATFGMEPTPLKESLADTATRLRG